MNYVQLVATNLSSGFILSKSDPKIEFGERGAPYIPVPPNKRHYLNAAERKKYHAAVQRRIDTIVNYKPRELKRAAKNLESMNAKQRQTIIHNSAAMLDHIDIDYSKFKLLDSNTQETGLALGQEILDEHEKMKRSKANAKDNSDTRGKGKGRNGNKSKDTSNSNNTSEKNPKSKKKDSSLSNEEKDSRAGRNSKRDRNSKSTREESDLAPDTRSNAQEGNNGSNSQEAKKENEGSKHGLLANILMKAALLGLSIASGLFHGNFHVSEINKSDQYLDELDSAKNQLFEGWKRIRGTRSNGVS